MAGTQKSKQTITTAGHPAGAISARLLSHREPNQLTLRKCVATNEIRPVSELIRFVAGPDDRIYPDLGCKLPGRGVWVTADCKHVEEAVKSRAFSRSLKAKTLVPQDLAPTVERLLEKRVIEAFSTVNKAGKVVSGFDKVNALIERGHAVVLVHASDAAPGGVEKLDRKSPKMSSQVETGRGATETIFSDCLTIDQMSLAIGRSNVVHAGLRDGGATKRFVVNARRLIDYRKGIGTKPRP